MSYVLFYHASSIFSASKAFGDNSDYLLISVRLHSGDFRTDWTYGGLNQGVSITRASQCSDDKLKTKSITNPQKPQGKIHVFVYFVMFLCLCPTLEEKWSHDFWTFAPRNTLRFISKSYSTWLYFDSQSVGRCSQPENLSVPQTQKRILPSYSWNTNALKKKEQIKW